METTENENTRYTIDDLCELTGASRRTIRYFITQKLLAPPAGRGRGGFYSEAHLERLKAILEFKEKRSTLTLGSDPGLLDEVQSEGVTPVIPFGTGGQMRSLMAQAVQEPLAAQRMESTLYVIDEGVILQVTREAELRLGDKLKDAIRAFGLTLQQPSRQEGDKNDEQ